MIWVSATDLLSLPALVAVAPFNGWTAESVQEEVSDVSIITLGTTVWVGRRLLPLCLPLGVSCSEASRSSAKQKAHGVRLTALVLSETEVLSQQGRGDTKGWSLMAR